MPCRADKGAGMEVGSMAGVEKAAVARVAVKAEAAKGAAGKGVVTKVVERPLAAGVDLLPRHNCRHRTLLRCCRWHWWGPCSHRTSTSPHGCA